MPRKKGAKKAGFDVRGLRKKLGVSQEVFAKMAGASPNSVYNWERGTAPNEKFLTKLRALASGKVAVPAPSARSAPQAPKKLGRPPKAPGKPRGRPPSIRGEIAVIYANRAHVQASGGEARLRFGLAVPGEPGVRAVADIVIPGDLLARLR